MILLLPTRSASKSSRNSTEELRNCYWRRKEIVAAVSTHQSHETRDRIGFFFFSIVELTWSWYLAKPASWTLLWTIFQVLPSWRISLLIQKWIDTYWSDRLSLGGGFKVVSLKLSSISSSIFSRTAVAVGNRWHPGRLGLRVASVCAIPFFGDFNLGSIFIRNFIFGMDWLTLFHCTSVGGQHLPQY